MPPPMSGLEISRNMFQCPQGIGEEYHYVGCNSGRFS